MRRFLFILIFDDPHADKHTGTSVWHQLGVSERICSIPVWCLVDAPYAKVSSTLDEVDAK